MRITNDVESQSRKPTNLTIRKDILDEAKMLKLNTSKAAEIGILLAIKETKSQEWLKKNRKAILAHNKRFSQKGALIKPSWDNS